MRKKQRGREIHHFRPCSPFWICSLIFSIILSIVLTLKNCLELLRFFESLNPGNRQPCFFTKRRYSFPDLLYRDPENLYLLDPVLFSSIFFHLRSSSSLDCNLESVSHCFFRLVGLDFIGTGKLSSWCFTPRCLGFNLTTRT